MLDYEGGKHIAPHTYIGATTYAVHFFQRGCFAHHRCWITRRETQSPGYVYSCNNLHYTFLPARLLCTPTYVYWCNLRCTFLPARLLYTATDARLRRQETHSPTHSWCNSLCCTFLPVRLLSTPTASELRRSGKTQAPHTYTAEAAYAVHFFQRGYSAHPQILDYEGRKHTATHTYKQAAQFFLIIFLLAKLLSNMHSAQQARPPTYTMMDASHEHISCYTFLQRGYCAHPQRF